MKEYKFDAKKVTQNCIDWIKKYFVENGDDKTVAVIGISGGKDSSVAAALCAKALGKDSVIGVKMPQGNQEDIEYANKLIGFLGIKSMEINIGATCNELLSTIYKGGGFDPLHNFQVTSNLPARIRMTTLYAVAAQFHGRVVNTCNLSEDYVGYSTKFGDAAGDFSPLSHLTSDEVIEVGRVLGLPEELLTKPPEDGLSGVTDEDNLGFTYAELNAYLRQDVTPDFDTLYNIEIHHKRNIHKLEPMPSFDPRITAYHTNHPYYF